MKTLKVYTFQELHTYNKLYIYNHECKRLNKKRDLRGNVNNGRPATEPASDYEISYINTIHNFPVFLLPFVSEHKLITGFSNYGVNFKARDHNCIFK